MSVNVEAYHSIQQEFVKQSVTLIAVSKLKPASDIEDLYKEGQRDFGENYVQELVSKKESVAQPVNWHFIGHVQTNKIKYLVPFVKLVHGITSVNAIAEVSKRSVSERKITDILLQVHIASEETKFGFDEQSCIVAYEQFLKTPLQGVRIRGLMGMASFTKDDSLVASEFRLLRLLFEKLKVMGDENFDTLSMGMSSDYKIALEEGSTMVRVGSLLFGARNA